MNKILYDKITSNDNWVLVAQALIDKQAEIVEHYNAIRDWITETEKILNNMNEFNHISVKKLEKVMNWINGLEKLAEKQEIIK